MYLLRTPILNLALFTLLTLLPWIGGWLIATHVFSLRPRERGVTGLAIGFLLWIVITNGLTHFSPLSSSFVIGGLIVFCLGLAGARKIPLRQWFTRDDLKSVPVLVVFLGLFALFVLINRGVAILDERYNLPLVSRIAAGDVPPHFYLYPTNPMPYHYALHLFAGGLQRMGGLFSWSAFDLSKALSQALSLSLAWIWFRRITRSLVGGIFGTLLVYLAGGTRWFLLFAPASWMIKASASIQLINSAVPSGRNFYDALVRPWNIEGVGPIPFPFAFVSGVFLPQTLAFLSNGALIAMTIFLLLILQKKQWGGYAVLIMGLLYSSLALSAEHLFVLFGFGAAITLIGYVYLHKNWKPLLHTGWFLILGAVLAASAGGVISILVERSVSAWLGNPAVSGYGVTGFFLQWPPAVMSFHLGRLSLLNPTHLILAFCEIGPVIFLAPLTFLRLKKYIQRGEWVTSGLMIGALVGFLLALVIGYQERDREITRLMDVALLIWVALGYPLLWHRTILPGKQRRLANLYPLIAGVWYVCVSLTGMVTFASELVAIARPQLTVFIQPIDAQFTQQYWDRLPSDVHIFDPSPQRAIVVFGRPAGFVSADFKKILPEWVDLVEKFNPLTLAQAGYSFIYMDEVFWKGLPSDQKNALDRGCVKQVKTLTSAAGEFRSLYDIRTCR